VNRTAYTLLTPALLVMTACGLLPMGFVFFYALHDTFMGNSFVWVGARLVRGTVLASIRTSTALPRAAWALPCCCCWSRCRSACIIALRMPARGFLSALYIVLLAIPLLTPSIVVGYLWKILVAPQGGTALTRRRRRSASTYDMNNAGRGLADPGLMMDAWHWTSLVVLLCLCGPARDTRRIITAPRASTAPAAGPCSATSSCPEAAHGAADRHPAALHGRLHDLYSEAYVVTRGGPGVATTFLSHELVQTALIQFDLGPGGAMAIIYFAIIGLFSFLLFRLIVPKGGMRWQPYERAHAGRGHPLCRLADGAVLLARADEREDEQARS
jgi:glycerol transport system permease protein